MNVANSDELARVAELFEQLARDVPATPIETYDFFEDESGMFLTITLADGSETYIDAKLGERLSVHHVPLPTPAQKRARHLFSIRCGTVT